MTSRKKRNVSARAARLRSRLESAILENVPETSVLKLVVLSVRKSTAR